MRMAVRYPIGYLAVRDNTGRVHPESGTSLASRWGAMHVVMTRRNRRADRREHGRLGRAAAGPGATARDANLKAALDYMEEGDAAAARRHIRAAIRASGRALVNPRTWLALAGATGGAPVRGAIARLRVLESRAQVGFRARELLRRIQRAVLPGGSR